MTSSPPPEDPVERLREALRVAADDLGKAANQFASMRESQRAGHTPTIQSNPEKFAEKEARARAALEALSSPDKPEGQRDENQLTDEEAEAVWARIEEWGEGMHTDDPENNQHCPTCRAMVKLRKLSGGGSR